MLLLFGEQIKIVDDLQPVGAGKQELPYMKMEDTQYFAKLLEDVDEETLSADEQKERKIMRLLLKIKNGTPPMRKVRGRNIIAHFCVTFNIHFRIEKWGLWCQFRIEK